MEETDFIIEHKGDTDLYKLYLYSHHREVSSYALDKKHLLKLKKAIDEVLKLEHNNDKKSYKDRYNRIANSEFMKKYKGVTDIEEIEL